ncbi:inositol monophosphatase family protein [Acanthopleuribacter pedis]|uniref:Inositol-1-monophosphatase n=1 Tax=Acanthopleuribacter pedis TaxID=442870 RepID=A0A8J7QDQ4_9BACT|nr:inositol monophosphatase family protein [Acanthopleuribacter pedis]MBO1317198.1 inositol monophosphatase [Acanthopleuribacter pedis]
MEQRVEILKRAAEAAGRVLSNGFRQTLHIDQKGELDLVTDIDRAAERAILDILDAEVPEDTIVAEESGRREGSNRFKWIIDPLDGTTNFANGFPHFSVSIGLMETGLLRAGIVFDPIKDEWFEAHRGKGATLNGRMIRVGEKTSLAEALGVTGFSYDRRERMPELLARVESFLMHTRGLRRLGSAALDLCYVACGRFDVFLEDGLNAWDMAAGCLIVEESGGILSRLNGKPFDVDGGEVIACNTHLARIVRAHIR